MTRYIGLNQTLRDAAPAPVALENDYFDILGVFRLIRRRIGLIIAVAILVFVLAVPPIMAIKPSYHAYTRVLIEDPLATTLSVGSDARTNLNLATEMERLVSRDVSQSVVEALGLNELAEFNPALREPSLTERLIASIKSSVRDRVSAVFGTAPDVPQSGPAIEPPAANPLDPVIRAYLGSLSIGREAEGNIVSIGFTSQDPVIAAAVPNTLLKVYMESRAAEMNEQIRTAQEWFDTSIAEQRGRVQDAEADLDRFHRDAYPASAELRQANLDLIADLDIERMRGLRQRLELEATLRALDAAPTAADALALIQTPAAEGLWRDLQLRQRDLERLENRLGQKNVSVVAAQEALATTEAAVDVEIAQYRGTVTSGLAALGREERGIADARTDAQDTLLQQEEVLSRRTALGQSFSAEEAVLNRLEEQRRKLLARASLPLADIEVLMPTSLPAFPASRGRTSYLLVALVAAAALGLTAACAFELFDRSIRSPQQIRDVRGVGGAVLLPRVPRRFTRKTATPGLSHRHAAFGDSLRGMILSIERANGNRLPESLLVTSSEPAEGKSLIAAALAGELAMQGGPKVLLLDADLRRGRVHTMFSAPPGPGLSDLLNGDATLADVIRHDRRSGIFYVPVGTRRGRHLQNKAQLRAILTAARSHADIVIVDGPPSLVTTDATVLAQCADSTLFVAQWGRTSRQTLETGVDRLRIDPQTPLLVAINQVRPNRQKLYGFNDAPASEGVLRRYLREI